MRDSAYSNYAIVLLHTVIRITGPYQTFAFSLTTEAIPDRLSIVAEGSIVALLVWRVASSHLDMFR